MARFPGQTQLEADRPQGPTVAAELLALRTTVEFAPVGIAHFDLEGRVIWANRKLCEILGRSRKELSGRDYLDLTYAEDREACRALNARVAAGDLPEYRHEKRFVRGDGSLIWTRVMVSAVRDAEGRVAHFIGIAEDISEERRTFEQRELAEQRLRAALDASSTGTFRWIMGEDHVDCDEALLRLFGLEGATGRMPADMFIRRMHPEDQPRVNAGIARCNAAGTLFNEEFRVPIESGGMRWVRDVGKVFANPDGSLYMVGACTDVTAARGAQEESASREAQFRALANAIPQMVWIAHCDGKRTWFNDRWYEYTGLPFEEMRDHGWHRVHHPDHGPRVIAGQLEAFGRGEVWEDSFPLRRADGEYRWFLSRAVPIRDASGAIQRWFGSNTDVTEQMRALDAAQSARQLRDDMVAVVAHDLRNPLQTIVMGAGALQAASADADKRERMVAIIRKTAVGMGRLLDDLLDVSRMDAGTFAVAKRPLQVESIVSAALELFEARAAENAVRLETRVEPELGEFPADHDRLVQVLSNLVGNAMKFTPRGGHIEVACAAAGDAIEFRVSDTGPGIAPEHQERLFEKFWRADPASHAGAGLGLAISRGIVQAHGGTIRVESTPGRGTAVHFTIPKGP